MGVFGAVVPEADVQSWSWTSTPPKAGKVLLEQQRGFDHTLGSKRDVDADAEDATEHLPPHASHTQYKFWVLFHSPCSFF